MVKRNQYVPASERLSPNETTCRIGSDSSSDALDGWMDPSTMSAANNMSRCIAYLRNKPIPHSANQSRTLSSDPLT